MEDATVTLFTIRPRSIPGPPPEHEVTDGVQVRIRNGDDVQERYSAIGPDSQQQIERFAEYLYSTGVSVTMADGNLDQVESNVADRYFESDALDLAIEIVDCEERQLICNLSTLSFDPEDLGDPLAEWIDAEVVLTGEELKDIAVQLSNEFGFSADSWGRSTP